MNMAGLRFVSVYQGFGGNEEHKGEYANTVAQFADAIANGEAPELFGDGSQTRDFTHVRDVARACELAADEEPTGVDDVGTQEAYSVNETLAMINDALGTDIDPVSISVECPVDGYRHDAMADASKFREATGPEPHSTSRNASNASLRPPARPTPPGRSRRDATTWKSGRSGSRGGTHRIETNRVGGILL